MGMIIACIPKGLRCITARALVKGRSGNKVRDIAELISGVVQGSGIGPLMFLIYVNELVDILEKFGVKVKMFADDAKMYLRVIDDTDVGCCTITTGC